MSKFSFLESFPEKEATLFLNEWEKIMTTVSQPYSREGHINLINRFNEIGHNLTKDEVRFLTEDGKRVKFSELSRQYRRRMFQELQQDIPYNKQIEFNITEFLSRLWREAYDAESWSNTSIELTENRMTIEGYQVMDTWKIPIMRGMVDSCMAHYNGKTPPKVLELGWGMGISGMRFVEYGVDYTVVEAHAKIAENAKQFLQDRGNVVCNIWQNIKFEPGSFDIIFFDVYYTTHDPERDYFMDVMGFFYPLLKDGGIFTYFIDNNVAQITKLLENGFNKVISERITGFEVPQDCSYASPNLKYWLNILAIK